MMMPVLGVSSIFLYPKSVTKAIKLAAEMGFRHINIFVFPPHFKEDSEDFIKKVRNALFDYGLECSLRIQGYTINPAATNPNLRKKSIEEIKNWLTVAESIGCSSIIMRVGMFFFSEKVFRDKAFRTLVEGLNPIVEEANSKGIKVLAENYPYPFDVVTLPSGIIELARALKQKVYLALNIAHFYDIYRMRRIDLNAELNLVRSYVQALYFSEFMNPWDYPHKLNGEQYKSYLNFAIDIIEKLKSSVGTVLIIGYSQDDLERARKILKASSAL